MTGANWEFAFEAWVINVFYLPALNSSYWETPETVDVDDCGPANLISSGYALWLILVPAVACAVQLPGSVFLHGRSNFYRFAPEVGLADCFGTVSLLARALWKGYRWREAVAAVFLVREGIGKGDLWWRESPAEDQSPPPSMGKSAGTASDDEPATAIEAAVEDAAAEHDAYEAYRVRARLRPYSEPISLERMIGAVLFVVALVKTIATLAANPGHPAILIPGLVALSYSVSFVVLEVLVWSLVPVLQSYALEDIPAQNLVELLCVVDPGDNPFVFADAARRRSTDQGGNVTLELGAMGPSPPPSSPGSWPWNRAVAVFVFMFGLFGALLWSLILVTTWRINKGVFVVAISVVSVMGLRLAEKTSVLLWHRSLAQPLLRPLEAWARPVLERLSSRTGRLDKRLANDSNWFLFKWLLDRITIVNMFSGAWVAVICMYCVLLFPLYGLNGAGEQLSRPKWIDWLG